MVYDALLVFALLFLATTPFIAIRGGESVEPGDYLYSVLMLAVIYVFFVGFWTRPGRTLGMQSWGLQLESNDGGRATIGQATVRFFAAIASWAPLGLGFWWQLWDRERLTWHDRISGTRIVHYPRARKGRKN